MTPSYCVWSYLLRRQRLAIVALVTVAMLGIIHVFISSETSNGWMSRYMILNKIVPHNTGISSQGGQEEANKVLDICTFPNIDPFDPLILAHTRFYPAINCEGGVSHLVYLTENIVKVNHSKTGKVGDIKHPFQNCWYKALPVNPDPELNATFLYVSEVFTDNITLRDIDDNLVVECFDSKKTVLSRSYFSLIRVKKDIEPILEENYKKHITQNTPKEVLSVLMIGLDGNSKQNVERHMPKTRNYLLHVLNAIELHKYNRMAENTFSNLAAILTGKSLSKLTDIKGSANDKFLWSDVRKIGYRTALFFNNDFDKGANFYMNGLDMAPVDYFRKFTFLEMKGDTLMRLNLRNCVGDIPDVALNLDYFLRLARTFNSAKTPYFGFSFATWLTHDDHNMASAGDDLHMSFLQELKEGNLINNTVIIFFSDHGQRMGSSRRTYNGMIESNTPCMFFVFPPWFHRKYPELMKVLKINQERLTTNTDIYETLRDVVNFQAKTGLGDLNKKAISLFQEIPIQRSCQDADITIEYCLCNQMTSENASSGLAILLAETVERTIYDIMVPHLLKCHELHIASINNLMKIQTNNTNNDLPVYQVTIIMKPGGGIYEAKVKLSNSTKHPEVIGHVLRINMYRGQADCIRDTNFQPYCYCKNSTIKAN